MAGFIPVQQLDGTTNSAQQANLIGHFQGKYAGKPQFIVKVPGRVNLVGEHVDYSGEKTFQIFPMNFAVV